MKIHSLKNLLPVCLLTFLSPSLFAQGTAFTYQGALQANGAAAAGSYDLAFTLYDAPTNGMALAGPVTNAAVTVSHGLFTTLVDFGGAGSGDSNWLEIAVSTNGANAFATLNPRQPITPVPSALYALAASNVLGTVSAGQLTGKIATTNLSGTLAAGQLPAGTLTNGASGVTLAGALSGSFSGNGAALTNLSASNVAGILVWQSVTGTNQQAQANTGYLASNPGTVTLTLPASPSVGDVVRVSGIGAGGWLIAQNAGQSILRTVAYTNWSLLTNWTQSEPIADPWYSIASSSDGTKLAAAMRGGWIYTSTNAGSTWTVSSAPNKFWNSITSSSDGTKLAAVVTYGGIYTSTNAGATWTASSAPSEEWQSIASSSDGTKLAAVVIYDGIYTSTNAGATWAASGAPSEAWEFIASSSDGNKLAAVDGLGIYTTTNAGATWTASIAEAETEVADSIASSADGTWLVAAVDGGGIYTSTNAGSTWITTSAPGEFWTCVASSSDGTKLAAVVAYGGIYTSTNAGSTWTATSAPSGYWFSVASSSDGTKLAAVANGSAGIYTAQINNATSTTPGPAGYLTGPQNSAVELQYIGNNQWLPLSAIGTVNWY